MEKFDPGFALFSISPLASLIPVVMLSWKERSLRLRSGENGYTGVEKKSGAAGSHQSLKMDFEIDTRHNAAKMVNSSKRDLSGYNGMICYAKASKEMIAALKVIDSNSDSDKTMMDGQKISS